MGVPSDSTTQVRFGDFELDLRTGELRRSGILLKLQPQPTKALTFLVSRAGRVVTRHELAEQIWGADTFVDFEQGLNFAIRQIRITLEDDAEHPRFLETIPKKGYRFIGELTKTAQPQVEDPSTQVRFTTHADRTLIIVGVAIAIVLVLLANWDHVRDLLSKQSASHSIQSLAVLPLHNLSHDPEQEYFSDGMTDELITELAKIQGLRVISHTSVDHYKETKRPLPEIARDLGVDAVVEGTVMRDGDRVRITAQLIDARTDRHLWAESYERDFRDVFALQAEVAQQIASKVGINLTESEQQRLASGRVVDPAAHEAFLKGDFYWNKLNCSGYRKSLEYYRQATDKDPNYAAAYAGMADSYFNMADWGCVSEQEELFSKSQAAAQKALELDPVFADNHITLGELAFYSHWDWPTAEKEYKRAIELDSSEGHGAYAIFLVAMGRTDEGLAEMRKQREIDPTSELTNVMNTYVFYLAHRYDDAIHEGTKALELYPDSGAIYYWLAQSYEQKGMNEQAVAAYWKSDAGLGPQWIAASRNAYSKDGMPGFWRHQLAMKIDNQPVAPCIQPLLYAHMGDKERTLSLLSSGYERHCDGLQFLKVEPAYDKFRGDPRFKELVARLHL